MNIELLEKTFQNLHMHLSFEEAKEKAFLFNNCLKEYKLDIDDDYWIQLSKEWDLNVCAPYMSNNRLCLYPVKSTGDYMTTDNEHSYPILSQKDDKEPELFTKREAEQQNLVDDACYELITQFCPNDLNDFAWNIELIGIIRDALQEVVVDKLHWYTEMEFYPYRELKHD